MSELLWVGRGGWMVVGWWTKKERPAWFFCSCARPLGKHGVFSVLPARKRRTDMLYQCCSASATVPVSPPLSLSVSISDLFVSPTHTHSSYTIKDAQPWQNHAEKGWMTEELSRHFHFAQPAPSSVHQGPPIQEGARMRMVVMSVVCAYIVYIV